MVAEPGRAAGDHRSRRQERVVHAGPGSTRDCRTCTSTCSSRRTRVSEPGPVRGARLRAWARRSTARRAKSASTTTSRFRRQRRRRHEVSRRRADVPRVPHGRAVERERQVVIGEYDRNESSPMFGFSQDMGKALWGSAWSRKNPLGERAVIESTTPDKMRTIEKRYYIPNNTAIIITGDIAADRAFALAHSVFGGWQKGAGSVHRRSDSAHSAVDARHRGDRRAGDRRRDRHAAVAGSGRHGGPGRRPTPPTSFPTSRISPAPDSSDVSSTAGLFESIGVNYYTLNHVGPITIEGETTPQRPQTKRWPRFATRWASWATRPTSRPTSSTT